MQELIFNLQFARQFTLELAVGEAIGQRKNIVFIRIMDVLLPGKM